MIRQSRRQFSLLSLLLLSMLRVQTCYSGIMTNEYECPPACECRPRSEMTFGIFCINPNFKDIPSFNDTINTPVSLDIMNSQISVLRNDVFVNKKLVHLQFLTLEINNITTIEKNAFRNLSSVYDILLSHNQITELDQTTFRTNVELRTIFLRDNKIRKIEDELFKDLTLLYHVDMSHNRISHVSSTAFKNATGLKILNLSDNLLTQIELVTFRDTPIINSLRLMHNPWNCNCHMSDFVAWYKRIMPSFFPDDWVPRCHQPSFMQNRLWKNVDPGSFACKPEIVSLVHRLDKNRENLFLYCEARGDPSPEIHIIFNGSILDDITLLPPDRKLKFTSYKLYDHSKHGLNLTVHEVNRQDYGVYTCLAENKAGSVETNVTLTSSLYNLLSTYVE